MVELFKVQTTENVNYRRFKQRNSKKKQIKQKFKDNWGYFVQSVSFFIFCYK